MTEDEYENAANALLQKYGMNLATPIGPAFKERGCYYTSPKVDGNVMVRHASFMDPIQRQSMIKLLEDHLEHIAKI